MNANQIDKLIETHLDEARGGILTCSVSELARGQCTSRNYFLFKIDLAASTLVLRNTKPAQYARIAHAYLSTIDAITQQFGAESQQTEYQGDSVLAFFPERGNAADEVVSAAVQAHYAVNRLRHRVGVQLQPRLLLHFAALTVAKIGPWSESHRVAIGMPIHHVAKKEDEVGAGSIWLSDTFAAQCVRELRNQFLQPSYVERTVTERVLATVPPAMSALTLGDLFAGGKQLSSNAAWGSAFGLSGLNGPIRLPTVPQYVDKRVKRQVQDGYNVKLAPAYQALRLPLAGLG